MLFKVDVTINARRKQVWDFLTDLKQIGQCVPGAGKIEILELDELNRAKLKSQGTTRDGPALKFALNGPAFSVGVLGSRAAQVTYRAGDLI